MDDLLLRSGWKDGDGKITSEGFEVLRLLLENARKNKQRFPFPTWLELMHVGGVGVTIPVELAMIREGKNGKEVFLTRRSSNDPDFPNQLHFPGTYVWQGEEIIDTCRRVAAQELPGVTIVNADKEIGTSNNADNPRFHDFSTIRRVEYAGEPDSTVKGGWYPIGKKPPEDMIVWHKSRVWTIVKNHLAKIRTFEHMAGRRP